MDHKEHSESNQRHKFLTEVGVLSNKVCCYPSATQHAHRLYFVFQLPRAHFERSRREMRNIVLCSSCKQVCRGSPVEMEAL